MKSFSRSPTKKNPGSTVFKKAPTRKETTIGITGRENKFDDRRDKRRRSVELKSDLQNKITLSTSPEAIPGIELSPCKNKDNSNLQSPRAITSISHKPSIVPSLLPMIDQMKNLLQLGIDFPAQFLNKHTSQTNNEGIDANNSKKRLAEFCAQVSQLDEQFTKLMSQKKLSESVPNLSEADLNAIDIKIKSAFERRIWIFDQIMNSIKEIFAEIIFLSSTPNAAEQVRRKSRTFSVKQFVQLYSAPSHVGTVAANILRSYSSCSVNDEAKGAINVIVHPKKLTTVNKFNEKPEKDFSLTSIGEELRTGIVLPVSYIRPADMISLQMFRKWNRENTTNYTVSLSEEVREENAENEIDRVVEVSCENSLTKSQLDIYETELAPDVEKENPCFFRAKNYFDRIVQEGK